MANTIKAVVKALIDPRYFTPYNSAQVDDPKPNTYQTPTMAPFCKDEEKYQVVEELVKQVEEIKKDKNKIDDQIITEVL